MEDKEIYKHLANVYLSKPTSKSKKSEVKFNPVFLLLLLNTVIIGTLLFIVILDRLTKASAFKITTYSLNINDNDHPLKIKYSLCNPWWPSNRIDLYFDDIKLAGYKNLRLFVKGDNNFTKRVVMFLYNKNGSKAVSVLNNISEDWKVFVVPFQSFEGIKDLTEINRISFGIENWHINYRNGNIYIGDITFLH